MIMVIIMHTVYNFSIRNDFFATKLWFVLEPITAISKTCVLLFFMLSGYLVIHKQRSIHQNWQKTKTRILIPLLFFSTLNLLYTLSQTDLTQLWQLNFWQTQLIRSVHFPSSPLWFLIVLFFFYLLNPLWQKLFNPQESSKTALYIIKLSFLFSALITIIQFPSLKSDTIFNNFTAWIGFICFYLYGGAVKNTWIKIDGQKINLWLFSSGFLLTLVGDFITSWTRAKQINFIWTDYTANYLSLPVIMMAIGLFNLLLSNKLDLNPKIESLISWLAGVSFGIYLTHSYVVSIFTDILGFDFNKLSLNVYIYNALNFSLVFAISLIITLVIKKLPMIKRVVGE